MTTVRLPATRRRAVAVALACATFAVAAHAQEDWRAPRVVTWQCAGCHGIDGNAQWPTMPRLAGQDEAYMRQQIAAFRAAPAIASIEVPAWLRDPPAKPADARDGRDARTFMIGPAHALGADDEDAAARWYAGQRPLPGAGGDPGAIARGREIYAKGDPKAGVIACQDCHGVEGKGLATFPRLAGQHASYLVRQLQAFASGARPPAAPMQEIAKGLSPEDRAAVAAYLQSL